MKSTGCRVLTQLANSMCEIHLLEILDEPITSSVGKPYKYRCIHCGTYLKIASGIIKAKKD